MLLDNWCLLWIFWLLVSMFMMLAMANTNIYKYFHWKGFMQYISGILEQGGGDKATTSASNPEPKSFKNAKSEECLKKPSEETVKSVLMFSYQDSGKVEEKMVCHLQPKFTDSDSLCEEELDSFPSSTSEEDGPSRVKLLDSREEHGIEGETVVQTVDSPPNCTSFIKWIPFTEEHPSSKYDLFLEKENSPRNISEWKSGNHQCSRSKSATSFEETTPHAHPIRLTISDSAIRALSKKEMNHIGHASGSGDKHMQGVQCDPSRFEYNRNRRYIATVLHQGVHMKATLYLQLPEAHESSRTKMKADLLMVLLKSFLWPWEDVHIKWVPSLVTWLITMITADAAIPVFKNTIVRSNCQAVLLFSKAAARQVRHQDLVFLFNLAMLLQTTPDQVLLLQQVN